MRSLFSRLKSHIKQHDNSPYPGGRYMAMVLKEVFTDVPGFAKVVFGVDQNGFDVEIERSYNGGTSRTADLRLVEDGTKKVLAVMEVKYKDQNGPSIHNQIPDYVAWAQKSCGSFVLLSKHPPEPCVLKRLGTCRRCSYWSFADLYREVERYRKHHDHPTLRLFCDFLKEDTPVFDERRIDEKALQLLLRNVLDLDNKNDLGRKLNKRERMFEATEILNMLVKNISVLADEFHASYGGNVFGNKPSVGFRSSPWFKLGNTKREIDKMLKEEDENNRYVYNEDDDDQLPRKRDVRVGGHLSISANYVVRGKPYLSFWNGISCQLRVSPATSLRINVEAGIWPNGDEDAVRKVRSLTRLTNEKYLAKALKEVSALAVNNVLDDNHAGLSRQRRIVLTRFKETLEG